MGQTPSQTGANGNASSSSTFPFPKLALHVVRVADGSPCHLAGIQPFFDYLIGVDLLHRRKGKGRSLASSNPPSSYAEDTDDEVYEEPIAMTLDPEELARVLDENEGKEIGLRVWNAKLQQVRYVTLTPTHSWSTPSTSSFSSTQRPTTLSPSLLGVSLRVCRPTEALEQVWHILEVLEGSPAEDAGLVPYGDYIIGWTEGALEQESDFYDLVEQHIEKSLRLYVYSADLDNLREIVLVPNRQWGGIGLLGCGVGYGLLHRIPIPNPSASALASPAHTTLFGGQDSAYGTETPGQGYFAKVAAS